MLQRTPVVIAAVTALAVPAGLAGAGSTPDSAPQGPYAVEHAMGTTELPAPPERVVVLDSSFLDSAVALGVTPVGATEGVALAGLPAYLPADVLESVEIVGETNAPNLEAVAALEPDLIIGAKVRHEDLYDELSALAPTVFSESSGTNWTEQVRLTGAALGRSAEAEALLAEFDERAAAVGAAIGADGMTATIVRFLPDQTRLYGPGTFSGSVLAAVGFDLGDKGYADFSMALISTEQIGLVDADVVFATTISDEADADTTRPQFEELWNSLTAVQNGRQFDVRSDIWMTGIGVLGAHLILDDLEALLGPEATATATTAA
jgi:iron complex transport system substrate-binding protein